MSDKSKASLGRPLPDASLPRNPFDRSHSVNNNTKMGFIEPVFSSFCPPGSHVEINRSEVFRTADVNTAAMVGFDHYIDFFAVPLRLLWSEWDNYTLNISDQHSSFTTDLSQPEENSPQRGYVPAYSVFSMIQYLDGYDDLLIPGTGEFIYPGFDNYKIRKYNARRLLNRLKYGVAVMNDDPRDWGFSTLTKDDFGYVYDHSNEFQNLFRLCAYQKIYYDHYRNTSYESQSPFFYNLDWLKPGVVPSVSQAQALFAHLTDLHSVNYRNDFFTAVYPALTYVPVDNKEWYLPNSYVNAYTSVSVNGETGTDYNRWFDSSGSLLNSNYNVYGNASSHSLRIVDSDQNTQLIRHNHNVQVDQTTTPIAYNVQAIRAAFALDKLKRASAYAPRHIKDQYEARYGFKFKGDDFHCTRIGSFKMELNLSEVTQTTPTETQPLGTIGGKGYNAAGFGDTIEYDCGDGETIIMGLSYFVPRLCYDTLALDPFNCKIDRSDFIIPEFMDLGLQPMYQKYIQFADETGQSADDINNRIKAYQVRYQEYKTEPSRNFGLFNFGNQLSVFTSHFDVFKQRFGTIWSDAGLTWRYFKVLPSDVDNIFVTAADPTEFTDQFYGFINFYFKCNQNLSIHGQPKL